MKNKALKKIILLGVFAFSIFGANNAMASRYYYDYANPYVGPYSYDYSSNISNYDYVSRASSQVKYISQPTVTQIEYVPQQNAQTIEYINPSSTTSNTNNNTVKTTKVVTNTNTTTRNRNTSRVNDTVDTTNNSGEYINYDVDSKDLVNQDNSGNGELTALSVRGSGSFMPSSFFQWFLFILIVLAIIIVARMIGKTFNKNNHNLEHH